MMLPLQIHLTLPPWIEDVADASRRYVTDEERVGLAIELSRHNIQYGSGGPFGAAVFDEHGRLISAAANRVVAQTCSASASAATSTSPRRAATSAPTTRRAP